MNDDEDGLSEIFVFVYVFMIKHAVGLWLGPGGKEGRRQTQNYSLTLEIQVTFLLVYIAFKHKYHTQNNIICVYRARPCYRTKCRPEWVSS